MAKLLTIAVIFFEFWRYAYQQGEKDTLCTDLGTKNEKKKKDERRKRKKSCKKSCKKGAQKVHKSAMIENERKTHVQTWYIS